MTGELKPLVSNFTQNQNRLPTMAKSAASGTRKLKAPRRPSTKKTSEPAVVKETPPPSHTLILDNGGDSVRYGWSSDTSPTSMPNMTARLPQQWTVPVGDQILQLQNPNLAAITRSTERGIIHNLGNQVQVWKRILDLLQVVIIVGKPSDAATVYGWKQQQPTASSILSTQCAVLIGLAPLTPRCILDQIVAVWIEDLGFSHVGFYVSSVAAARPSRGLSVSNEDTKDEDVPIACVVDIGWSATWVVPVLLGEQPRILSLRRMALGGRQLMQIWKYWVTYRQWNLMDQDFVVRHAMEQTSFVSLDFPGDMKRALRTPSGRRPWDRNYVLPDYDTTREGVVQIPEAVQRELDRLASGELEQGEDEDSAEDEDYNDDDMMKDDDGDEEVLLPDTTMEPVDVSDDEEDEAMLRQRLLAQRREEELRRRALEESQQVLRISTERFAISEILFQPQDAGLPLEWAGLPLTIVQAIEASPELFRPALYQSIQLLGGLSQLPNLLERLESEVRVLAPCEYKVRITKAADPTCGAWHGAREIAKSKPYRQWSVGRDEWNGTRGVWERLLSSKGGLYT